MFGRNTSLAVLALMLLFGVYQWLTIAEPPVSDVATRQQAAEAQLARWYAGKVSGHFITVATTVERVLPDDNKGSRHQRFIVRVNSDMTLLVAHNIDLAPRVPLKKGDALLIKGQYEWNAQGGVLHWTHHDPDGDIVGGWIEYNGRHYR